MITKTDLKAYEFQNIEEYFTYILDSKINGQHTQVRELFNDLSKKQKNDFFEFIDTFIHYDKEPDNLHESGELLKYFNNL